MSSKNILYTRQLGLHILTKSGYEGSSVFQKVSYP